MQPPKEFKDFGVRLHQDVLLDYNTWDEAVRAVARNIGPERAAAVTAWLAQVIASDCTSDELSEIWRRSRSDYYVTGPGVIEFFKKLRAAFD